jgi:hypothetical protein
MARRAHAIGPVRVSHTNRLPMLDTQGRQDSVVKRFRRCQLTQQTPDTPACLLADLRLPFSSARALNAFSYLLACLCLCWLPRESQSCERFFIVRPRAWQSNGAVLVQCCMCCRLCVVQTFVVHTRPQHPMLASLDLDSGFFYFAPRWVGRSRGPCFRGNGATPRMFVHRFEAHDVKDELNLAARIGRSGGYRRVKWTSLTCLGALLLPAVFARLPRRLVFCDIPTSRVAQTFCVEVAPTSCSIAVDTQ